MKYAKIFVPLILLCCAFFFFTWEKKQHTFLYLTWMHDPTTTMTVQWHAEKAAPSQIFYKPTGSSEWQTQTGTQHALAGAALWGEIFVHTVELTSLQPGTDYTFRIAQNGKEYRFRTMPQKLIRPLHFVVGGDVYQGDIILLRKMNARVAQMDPDFIVLGGDIAYTYSNGAILKGRYFAIKRWQTFFKAWQKQMRTSDGRLIPILPLIGNHDTRKGLPSPHKKSVLFYEIFSLPEKNSYRTVDFGSYLSLFLLDTEHTHPIAGVQTEWLKQALTMRQDARHKMAIYHVSAYPSVNSSMKKSSMDIRQNWVPLFEKFGVKTAFEHHDHAFKRTHRIKDGKIDQSGVVYLGDGGWGADQRLPHELQERWYLAKTATRNFVYLITLQPDTGIIQAIDNKGRVFDQVSVER